VDLNLALLYVQGGTEKQALEEAQRVLAVEPKQETALRIVGDLQFQAGQFGEARRTYERLLLLGPSEEIWRRVARAYESEGDSLKAAEATKKADALTAKPPPQQATNTPMSNRYRLGVLFSSIFAGLAIAALSLRFLYSETKGIVYWLRTGEHPGENNRGGNISAPPCEAFKEGRLRQ
jgi:tetratricopeptide (TPR) repeat protein